MLSAEEIEILCLTAKVALWATFLSLPFAIAMGWILARYNFYFKPLLETLIQLPMVLPPVVTGYLLLVLFGQQGLFGNFLSRIGIHLVFDWKGAVLASMVVAFPLMVQPIKLSFELIHREIEQVAASLGASPWQVFRSISLPMIRPGLIIGCILCFSRSLGEFGATITFVGNIPHETQTVPIAIYTYLQRPDGDEFALRLVICSIVLTFMALMTHHLILRKYKKKLGTY